MMNSRKKYKLSADKTKGPRENIDKHKYTQKVYKENINFKVFQDKLFVLRSKFLTILVARLPKRFAL